VKTFKKLGTIGIEILATFPIASCSAEKVTAYKNMSGAQLWGQNCIRCHSTPSPADYNDTDWSTISLHMKIRANLTTDQSNKIFEFIKSAN
jgi:hypothetical protein